MTTITSTVFRPAASAGLMARVSALWQSAFAADQQSAAVRELNALADRYEASQPSFAADLRAAAQRQA